ncbi:phage antirepressor KilAC domain-containing protein [Paenibacillus sp. XY044]|uniref:phage antirepressor KilAC domain-containing protein n=1 Tax=Paenibacillus sp. XY044 TaxID=2026089 RepID=UPI000B985727|nr:phage antirepressor KilAC domain-containing protein [Paenibacillus sp. XY044]OZB90051.1 hypothetical protein CJP46_35315 [Paenibacillus sp. XY044]
MSKHPIIYKEQRVLTSHQLAEAYGTDNKSISNNFNNNKDRYKRDKHFYVLQGAELKSFKSKSENLGIAVNANIVYLWTEKGAWMHAKSLNTDQAWEAYEMLVDEYYRVKEVTHLHSYMIDDPIIRAEKWIEEEKERRILLEGKLLLERKVSELAPKIAYYDIILKSKSTVNTTQIAKDYGLTANELNKILKDQNVQYKVGDQWVLYKNYADKGYTQSETFNFTHRDGAPDVRMMTKWTQRGRIFIHQILTELGIKPNIEKEYPDAR